MFKKKTPPPPEPRSSERPDYYPFPGECAKKRRTYVRDLCVVSACLTMLFVSARAMGYL